MNVKHVIEFGSLPPCTRPLWITKRIESQDFPPRPVLPLLGVHLSNPLSPFLFLLNLTWRIITTVTKDSEPPFHLWHLPLHPPLPRIGISPFSSGIFLYTSLPFPPTSGHEAGMSLSLGLFVYVLHESRRTSVVRDTDDSSSVVLFSLRGSSTRVPSLNSCSSTNPSTRVLCDPSPSPHSLSPYYPSQLPVLSWDPLTPS